MSFTIEVKKREKAVMICERYGLMVGERVHPDHFPVPIIQTAFDGQERKITDYYRVIQKT